MDVLTILRSKNNCLERFLALSLDFAKSMEANDLSGLAKFQENRENIIKALDLYDRKVSEVLVVLSPGQRTPQLIQAVEAALAKKDELVHRILEEDLKIISGIEDAKNETLKELSATRKNKDLVGKFKSTWMTGAGEGLDKKL